jgi:long-chain acyl-CoA synthetase
MAAQAGQRRQAAGPAAGAHPRRGGRDLPNGQAGGIYQQLPPGGAFTYYKDEAKTRASRVDDFFTMGDVGYFDEDDYLFLTGRNAETIISGGVNIYPQEIDNELVKHAAVADSATIGAPHDEWGEQVKAVILLNPGTRAERGAGRGNPGLRQGGSAPASRFPRASTSSPNCPGPRPARSSATRCARPTGKAVARQI